jgi:nitrite reductase (NADH) large subunit
MRILVVGNGLAGTIAAKTLRELDSTAEIDIFAEEKYLYYPRPNLIEFLAGTTSQTNIFAFSEDWYANQNIPIYLEKPIKKIHPHSKEIELEGEKKELYDKLLLANGASSWKPPIIGEEKRGVYTLRTLDDALNIIEWIKDHPDVAIIGGGLLGLEIARAVRSRGARVQVVEFFPRLLPRQLDAEGASVLQSKIQDMGIEVKLGIVTEEILGKGEVEGLKFKDGAGLEAKTAIVAAGVRPNVTLAAEAGLETDKGIIVDDYLQTSHADIFAAGDNVQHKDKVYGIIPAAFNQARTVAFNISGQKKKYLGTIPSNTLKVVGLDLTAIGVVTPDVGTCEEYRKVIKEKGIYKKIVIQNGKLIGAIWMGTKKNVTEINRIILQQIDVSKWKDSMLEDDFDYSVL